MILSFHLGRLLLSGLAFLAFPLSLFAQVPIPPKPVRLTAQELWQDSARAFATLESSSYKGAGFLCKLNNETVLITSASVMAQTDGKPKVTVAGKEISVTKYLSVAETNMVVGKLASLPEGILPLTADPDIGKMRVDDYMVSGGLDGKLYRSRVASVGFTEVVPFFELEGASGYHLYPAQDGCPVLRESNGLVIGVSCQSLRLTSSPSVSVDKVTGKRKNFHYSTKLSSPRIDMAKPESLAPWDRPSQGPFELLQSVSESVVIFEGGGNKGNGFVASYNGGFWVVTTDHVLLRTGAASLRTAKGEPLAVAKFFASRESGVVIGRLAALPPGVKALEIAARNSALPNSDLISPTALGDAYKFPSPIADKGQEVLTNTITHELPSVEDLSATPGMPIVSLRQGKVVGVVTHMDYDYFSSLSLEGPNNTLKFNSTKPPLLTLERMDLLEKDKWTDWTAVRENTITFLMRSTEFVKFSSNRSVIAPKERELAKLWKFYSDDALRTRMAPEHYSRVRLSFLEGLSKYVTSDMAAIKKEREVMTGTRGNLYAKLLETREAAINDFNTKIEMIINSLPVAPGAAPGSSPPGGYPRIVIKE